MQILKEEVRNRILQAARAEFSNHGYIRTSVRGIAKVAGITPGNIYRYFQDKDALFGALLDATYQQFLAHMLQLMEEIDARMLQCSPMSNEGDPQLDETVGKMVLLVRDSSVEVMLLFTQSEGSAYAQAKVDFTTLISRIIYRVLTAHLDLGKQSNEAAQALQTADMLAHSLIEGLCHILRQHRDAASINHLMDQLLSIYSLGLSQMLRQHQ